MPNGNIRSTRSLSEESGLIVRLMLMVPPGYGPKDGDTTKRILVMDHHLLVNNQGGMLCMSLRFPVNKINSEYV